MNILTSKSDIELSHERCERFSIDLHQVYSRKIISEGELQRRFTDNRNLIVTAAPYMEH